jgi:CRISPR-associated endonuclease Csn1
LEHLGQKQNNPEIAFSPEGIEELNQNLTFLNDGKPHQPVYKVRTFEPKGNKFSVGQSGNKKDKYVEAAKGTNLFFAIYQDENGKRSYETIPLNIVIERQKQGLAPCPEENSDGLPLLFYLSPNDLVYMPEMEERDNLQPIEFQKLKKKQAQNVYKMVSSSGTQCFFVKSEVAVSIVNKIEFSALNKMEKSIDGRMIKDICAKLKVDRLGNISI